MPRLAHRILVFIGFGLGFAPAFTAGRAAAQDNFDANKTPAQLFANDCSGCHKSPAGLSKAPGMFGVESFLREHYTASRQAAAAIAGYLRAVDAEQPPAPNKRGKSEPRRKADKKNETKPEAKAKTEAKPETKPETKTEPKAEAKSEAKTEPKAESKPEAKPEAKVEAKPAGEKPPAEKPADKTEKSN
jgi:outer membrane biosynthesis protein TonB